MADDNAEHRPIEDRIQKCYATWGSTYFADYLGSNAAYPPVHFDHLRNLIGQSGAKSLLDAGCGPASFLRTVANDGVDLYGFDLTAEMVAEGKRVFADLSLDPDKLWQGSVLDAQSYVVPHGPSQYDAAVCIGVLPHVAEQDEERVFKNLHRCVRPGGRVVIEARNQLFSLFTANRPTYEFIRDELIRATELLSRAGSERGRCEEALETLKTQFRMDLPPVRRGKSGEPGYDEVLSRSHNPLTLKPRFEAAGFRDVNVLFYHFHALPPMLGAGVGDLFLRESVAQENPTDWRGTFMASAFMLTGVST